MNTIKFTTQTKYKFNSNKLQLDIHSFTYWYAFFGLIALALTAPALTLDIITIKAVWVIFAISLILSIIIHAYYQIVYVESYDASVKNYISKNKKVINGFNKFLNKATKEELIEMSKILKDSKDKIKLIEDEINKR